MEEMFRLQQYEPLWEDWHVDKLLHEGSMSNVYQVKSEKSTGVIKVISVPKLQPEGRLNGQGENEKYETMNVFFKEVVESLVEEIERVGVLNYIPNVLGYRKWQVFQRKEDVGYDLILLMDKEESLKDYLASHEEVTNVEIVRIVKEVMHSRKCNSEIHDLVKGVMIESYIEEGCQKIGDGIYGKSITDPCLGWADTERLLYDLAELNA